MISDNIYDEQPPKKNILILLSVALVILSPSNDTYSNFTINA